MEGVSSTEVSSIREVTQYSTAVTVTLEMPKLKQNYINMLVFPFVFKIQKLPKISSKQLNMAKLPWKHLNNLVLECELLVWVTDGSIKLLAQYTSPSTTCMTYPFYENGNFLK